MISWAVRPLSRHPVGPPFQCVCNVTSLPPACAACLSRRLFYFYIFQKHFLQKYIFDFTIYSFIPLPPGRGTTEIYMYIKIICAEALGGSLPPPCRAAGSPMLYKRVSLPPPPHLLPTTSREREGERRGEGGSCNSEALPVLDPNRR